MRYLGWYSNRTRGHQSFLVRYRLDTIDRAQRGVRGDA